MLWVWLVVGLIAFCGVFADSLRCAVVVLVALWLVLWFLGWVLVSCAFGLGVCFWISVGLAGSGGFCIDSFWFWVWILGV